MFTKISASSTVASRPCAAAAPLQRRGVRAQVASGAATPYVPERKFLHDVPESQWRNGKPTYDLVNAAYLKGKTKNWAPGSLEDIVEVVVKSFEMEISHKTKPEYIKSFAPGFKYSQNGGPKIEPKELLERGSYNVLITDSSYTSREFSFEQSHDEFKAAFPDGFAWEVTEVLAGPPNVTFRWRHWGEFKGPYAGYANTNETIEMYGMAIARVNDQLQIEELEIFYDPTDFLTNLSKGGKCPLGFGSKDAQPAAAAGTSAPGSSSGGLGGIWNSLFGSK